MQTNKIREAAEQKKSLFKTQNHSVTKNILKIEIIHYK